ncbi:MAG: Hsp70 family protein, partial [Alphaproteobacteria bacterium]|nr:Hsp70 family protein [Alphaproteobacteria bacterium]
LGQFDLVGIPPAQRGVPQIEVTFDIDANGIVQVSAKDKATGKEQQIRIQASGGLSDDDIKRMVKEAEEHASEDKQRKEQVEVHNRAESLIHTVEKSLQDAGDKVPPDEKFNVEQAVDSLRAALEGNDSDAIAQKTDALQQVSMKLGEYLYRAQQEAGAGAAPEGGDAPESGSDEPKADEPEVVDAEFTEMDDNDDKKKSAG